MTAPAPEPAPTPLPCPFCGAEMVSHFAGVWGHPDEPSDCWSASILAIAPAMLPRWNRRVPPPSDADAVASAARVVIAARFSTYKARNGREVGIEDASGEKCWVVPSDEMHALEQALLAPSVPPPGQAALIEALRGVADTPLPIASFNWLADDWFKAAWTMRRRAAAALSTLPDGRAAAGVGAADTNEPMEG